MAGKKPKTTTPETPPAAGWAPDRDMGLARALQKAGYGTRHKTTGIITAGRVTVNGKLVKDPAHMTGPGSVIQLDKKPLAQVAQVYFALHKPARVVCAPSEAADRRQVAEFLPPDVPGLVTAGRMDSKTTGLLLVSNDTAWNNAVAGSASLEQEYRIQVEGEMSELEISVISAGIHMPNLGIFRPASVRVVEKLNGRTVILMVIKGAKARMVRRMFSTLRHKITLLRRIRIGDIRLGSLPVGGVRPLTAAEVRSVAAAGEAPDPEAS